LALCCWACAGKQSARRQRTIRSGPVMVVSRKLTWAKTRVC